MLNIFVDASTYGQSFGAIYDFEMPGANGNLGAMRFQIQGETLMPKEAIYEKTLQEVLASNPVTSSTALTRYTEGIKTENKRVGALRELVEQLQIIVQLERTDAILVYVPSQLLREIVGGGYKFAICNPESNAQKKYYSDTELSLWGQFIEMLGPIYHRLIFKKFDDLRKDLSSQEKIMEQRLTPVQIYKAIVYRDIHAKISEAFRTIDMARKNQQRTQSTNASTQTPANNIIIPVIPTTSSIDGSSVPTPNTYNNGNRYGNNFSYAGFGATGTNGGYNPATASAPGVRNDNTVSSENQGNEDAENIAF